MSTIDLNDQQQRNLAIGGMTGSIDDFEILSAELDALDSFDTANGLAEALAALPADETILTPLGTDKLEMQAVLDALDRVNAAVKTADQADIVTIRTFRQKAGLLVAFPVR